MADTATGNGEFGGESETDMTTMARQRKNGKEKGVQLPIFSLHSPHGIGCFSKEAYDFVDWLRQTGHTWWQILPLNPAGCGDCPYQALSSFAGDAYCIDPEQLIRDGLLKEEELADYDRALGAADESQVDYEALYDRRLDLLRIAFRRFAERIGSQEAEAAEYDRFCRDNASWLEDYALFMALRDRYGREESWEFWPEDLRHRREEALREAADSCREDAAFYRWVQFEFDRQWSRLKAYANEAGVGILGDMTAFVSYNSADCWADPGQFLLDEDLKQVVVAGVPPDDFAPEGQKWGNPLYDWEAIREDGYRWWISRMRLCFRMYDRVRLDHFRGYEAFYAIPRDAENAFGGEWTPGPGMDLFNALDQSGCAGGEDLRKRFIAEDLGFLTDGVRRLLEDSGFPGMKVLQFAFDGNPANPYLPDNYVENCVAYTGTHDNDTTVGWFRSLSLETQKGILMFLGATEEEISRCDRFVAEGWPAPEGGQSPGEGAKATPEEIEKDPSRRAADLMIEQLMNSRADLVMIPIQDYLRLGTEARINIPGTAQGNWRWRMRPEEFRSLQG